MPIASPPGRSRIARATDRDVRQVAFLKRFTVFNVDQCDGLSAALSRMPAALDARAAIPHADALIAATRADIRIGGSQAFYAPAADIVAVPPRHAFPDRIDWYSTILHELGHWTGHASRLDRDQRGVFGGGDYAREELVAELASAFTCASLAIRPSVRHSDYIGAWLDVLRADERAIFRAASAAGKAADYLLAFAPQAA